MVQIIIGVTLRARPECKQSMCERREGKGAGSEHFLRNFFPYQRVTDGIYDVPHMEKTAFLQAVATFGAFSF